MENSLDHFINTVRKNEKDQDIGGKPVEYFFYTDEEIEAKLSADILSDPARTKDYVERRYRLLDQYLKDREEIKKGTEEGQTIISSFRSRSDALGWYDSAIDMAETAIRVCEKKLSELSIAE